MEGILLIIIICYQNVPTGHEASPECELEAGLPGRVRPRIQVKVLASVVATDQRRVVTSHGRDCLS